MATLAGSETVTKFINDMNAQYEKVHLAYEDNFWSTKMALKGHSMEALSATKTAYDTWLSNPDNLSAVRAQLEDPHLSDDQRHVLGILEKTFQCYITENPEAAQLKERLNQLEAELAMHRNGMELGHTPPGGSFVRGSSVQLRNTMRTAGEEGVREACYRGLRSIGPHVAERFCEIVKLRNRLARLQGFEDYYDMKVQQAEGFSKRVLFEMLDGLEQQTRPLRDSARAALAQQKGDSALKPWNTGFVLAGDVEKRMDPYFPFEDAVDVWARTFAALGISYRGATMTLDLCDREGKYSNGFCHWPQPAWRKSDGTWVPSRANFTSLATPDAVGSGKTALVTLMHEGGHAAHFANIDQRSPLFSQERAPTSVAYAENQSMLLDSLAGDADWMGRYCRDRSGQTLPWSLIEERLRSVHPYQVFIVRSMLSVPYFEKALYELPEEEVTPDRVVSLADEVEAEVEGGAAPRPLLSVPHILSDESSAYYHGYVLAEMSVHQTRTYFLSKYGHLTDNPEVGREITETYWKPGNGSSFLGLVEKLTGEPLTANAWVKELQTPTQAKVDAERHAYKAAVAAGPRFPPGTPVDMGMRVVLVHGDDVIADSQADGSLLAACTKYKEWIQKHWPREL